MNLDNRKNQNILIVQQAKKAIAKVEWIKEYSKGLINVDVVDISTTLPDFIDNSREYLPEITKFDLVLNYLNHPDLSDDLAALCINQGTPIVSPGTKRRLGENHYTPRICCALGKCVKLGRYGEYFGNPELIVSTVNGKISKIDVLRGSPCGSTWKASNQIIGTPIKDAATQFGLNTQFFCTANPSNWDPINSKNPIHLAAEVHRAAITKAIKNRHT